MPRPKKDSRTSKRPIRVRENCPFCGEKTSPDYKDTASLERYLTDRGKIVARARTGLCRRHQRQITLAIKRARHLALLPFIPGVQ